MIGNLKSIKREKRYRDTERDYGFDVAAFYAFDRALKRRQNVDA